MMFASPEEAEAWDREEQRMEARRGGERWAEIAIAHFLKVEAEAPGSLFAREAIRELAKRIEDRSWRRPEFQTMLDSDELKST